MPMIAISRWRYIDNDGSARCYERNGETWEPRVVNRQGEWMPLGVELPPGVSLLDAQGYNKSSEGEPVAVARIPNPTPAGSTPATFAKPPVKAKKRGK